MTQTYAARQAKPCYTQNHVQTFVIYNIHIALFSDDAMPNKQP